MIIGSHLPSDDLTALTIDGQDRIWIGTANDGIYILDPNGRGEAAWLSYTTTDGLPSNQIQALSTGQNGVIWASTAAGATAWSRQTESWTIYDQAGDALPDDAVLSLVSDPTNQTWIGTNGGLARGQPTRLKGQTWEQFHVPETTMDSDQVRAVAAEDNHLWVIAGDEISMRGVITKSIGEFIPVITSFSPSQAAPVKKSPFTAFTLMIRKRPLTIIPRFSSAGHSASRRFRAKSSRQPPPTWS